LQSVCAISCANPAFLTHLVGIVSVKGDRFDFKGLKYGRLIQIDKWFSATPGRVENILHPASKDAEDKREERVSEWD
jgi:hypothetical protein